LSASRFQHLFAEEIGVPFRRFRVWQLLRNAIGEIAAGSSFTTAAHSAGFADQAHFARAFRQAFGAPPSPSLRKVRRG
jgi:AraC-like DNA-binding protein